VSTSEYLKRHEIGPFLAAAGSRGVMHSALCHLLVYNGLRVSEACGADIEGLSFAGGHRTMHVLRKGGAEADVPLAPQTFRAVLLAISDRSSGPVLLDCNGNRMTRHSAARAVRLACKHAGIAKRIGPHALRHTYITTALSAKVPLRDVQMDAGHAQPATTIRYDHREEEMDRHSTYVVASWVGAA
jgi:integrase